MKHLGILSPITETDEEKHPGGSRIGCYGLNTDIFNERTRKERRISRFGRNYVEENHYQVDPIRSPAQ